MMMFLKACAVAIVVSWGLFGATGQARAQADPLLGQLMAVGFNFCPRGWADANGQLLPISSNSALFSLYGTIYGGDGRTTFALPDLRGRSAIHEGNGPGLPPVVQGERGGQTSFTLNLSTMPNHTHAAVATLHASEDAANQAAPEGNTLASAQTYVAGAPQVALNAASVTTTVQPVGGQLPVEKRSPYLTVRWCVALQGVFPSRN